MPKALKKVEPVIKRESVFDAAIEILYIALIFLAPVIFDRRVGIVFSLTKVTVIRLLIIAILTVWAIKIMLKQEHKFTRSPLDFPILSYLLAITIAALTSVNVLTSVIGFYGRYEGVTTLYIYGLLFFITTNFIKTKEQILRLMYTVIVAAVCMSLYGVIQRMGLDPYAWGGVITVDRVIGTIGQPNFLSAYVDMAFIIGLALLLNMKDVNWQGKLDKQVVYDLVLRTGFIFVLFLIFIGMLFTQSRGGFLGMLAGTSLFFLLSSRKLVYDKWRELLLLCVLIGLSLVISTLNPDTSLLGRLSNEAVKTVEMSAQETPVVGYNGTLSRLETWKSGYKIIVDRPISGIGQEVLKMVFPRYETNKFRFYEGFHVKQDRCHNEVCDMAVTRGVPALFIYVWILSTFFFIGVKAVQGDYDPELKLFTASFLGAAVAYIVQNQFSFGVVAITTLFWVLMGVTASIYLKQESKTKDEQLDMSNMPWLVFAVIMMLAIYLSYLSTIQFRADMHFKNAKSLADVRRIDYALKEYEVSMAISPYESGTWTNYGIATLNLAQISQNRQLIDKALNIFAIANKVDPYNADNFYISGRAYFILAMSGEQMMDKVISSEQNAIKIDPLYAEAYQLLGSVQERMGQNKAAADYFEKAVEINPQLSEAVAGLSSAYVRLGQSGKVIDIFKSYLEKYQNNPVFQENLAAIYVQRGDINAAIKIYEEMIAANPKNVRALVNLGFMSAKMGNMSKAKEGFESAIMVDAKSVDAHNGLGMIYLKAGQKDRARGEFSQSLMVDPNNQYAKQMLESIK